jgi:hypothetical protein
VAVNRRSSVGARASPAEEPGRGRPRSCDISNR